jgi:hypothetical protein
MSLYRHDFDKHDWTQYNWGWLSDEKCKGATLALNLCFMLSDLGLNSTEYYTDIQVVLFIDRMYHD